MASEKYKDAKSLKEQNFHYTQKILKLVLFIESLHFDRWIIQAWAASNPLSTTLVQATYR